MNCIVVLLYFVARGSLRMLYFAHSGRSEGKTDWESLREHLQRTPERSAAYATPFGLKKIAYVAGLFHDLGKYNPAFQKAPEAAKNHADHSTAGARLLLDVATGVDRLMAELAAYAILGHHAGLPDKKTPDASSFQERIKRFQNKLDPCWKEELKDYDLQNLLPTWLS